MEEQKNQIQNKENFPELQSYKENASSAMKLVDDIVLKNYLNGLSRMGIVPFEDGNNQVGASNNTLDGENPLLNDVIMFKINKMVYEKDEFATDKFVSVVSAMTYTASSLFLVVDGHEDRTDFYIGIKNHDSDRVSSSVSSTLKNSINGQFPGAILKEVSKEKTGDLLNKWGKSASISSCVGVPTYKSSRGDYTNANYIQGIEKLVNAMQGKVYTAIILASNTNADEIKETRLGYENIYTELSAIATRQLAYSTNDSISFAQNKTKGYSSTKGTSETVSSSKSTSKSTSVSESLGESKENKAGILSKGLMAVGGVLAFTGVGTGVGIAMMAAGAAAGFGAKNKSKTTTNSTSESTSETSGLSNSVSQSHSENFNESFGKTESFGTSKNFTITIQDKHVQEVLKRIDKQLERIEMCESTGLWSCSAYFLSHGTDRATAEIGATIFRSIMQGEQSGVESSAINTWYNNDNKFRHLTNYITNIEHPLFVYDNPIAGAPMPMLPTSLISSKELAMLIGLPRKSVPGLPVVEHISIGKEVVRLDGEKSGDFTLGCIVDQGIERKENKVRLDLKSLTQHSFVTGSTGCGKSETVYALIGQIRVTSPQTKFLIIEPAKGEYKNVFGTEHIFGTNPLVSNLLKINPFRFPKGVHVLEHIDRLIEIFNVCWPMYAAMPAVLKEAMLNAYEDCGWDLINSKNSYSQELFPNFVDLLNELVLVINNSSYSEEVKSNYSGSLITRVKSLANGIIGEIFSGNELGDKMLFDENSIVDISRIGSQETKSLIMGILIMRLQEYRSSCDLKANSDLRHVTILEEAHNILKRTSQEQSMEGSNVAGKSVEMISNAIAEMRTYGEGFIIVDQSPGAVDISAIRNTNTKIIMRLPEGDDRKVAGKSAAMKDFQIDEIAKLPTGVAVVYQNDWEEPVLCKVEMYNGKRHKYEFKGASAIEGIKKPSMDLIKFLICGRVKEAVEFNIDRIFNELSHINISTGNKILIYQALDEYNETQKTTLWSNGRFKELSQAVTDIIGARQDVAKIARTCRDTNELTQELRNSVVNRYGEFQEALMPTILQCVMRDYAEGDDIKTNLYNLWLKDQITII
jgi:hypothetical protein